MKICPSKMHCGQQGNTIDMPPSRSIAELPRVFHILTSAAVENLHAREVPIFVAFMYTTLVGFAPEI